MRNILRISPKTEAVPVAAVLASWASSFYFAANFPERVPTHWNVAGQPDGWSSAAVGAFLFPAIITGLYLMFLALPAIDPKRERYAEFAKPYHVFKASFAVLFFLIYAVTGLSGLGYDVPVGTVVPLLIGVLFVILGNYLSKVKMNWLIGIRTPWTLSDERIWNRTHRLAGKLFAAAGVVLAVQGFIPEAARVPSFAAAIAAAAAVPVAYSYVEYRRGGRRNLEH